MKNELRIEFSTLFNKQRETAPPEIKEAFLETLDLFLETIIILISEITRYKKNSQDTEALISRTTGERCLENSNQEIRKQ